MTAEQSGIIRCTAADQDSGRTREEFRSVSLFSARGLVIGQRVTLSLATEALKAVTESVRHLPANIVAMQYPHANDGDDRSQRCGADIA